jgi:hypothetical protein
MRTTVARSLAFLLVLLLFSALPTGALAQDSKSAALVKELTQLLDQAKLDSIAAKDLSAPDLYVAALYFQGSQLLVVSARYAAPLILNEKLAKKDFREIYTDLNSAAVEGTRTLVMDMGADGLKAKRDDTRFDTCDIGAKSYVFDGDWKKQKMASEDEYTKAFVDADARYAKMLAALIVQAKKSQ